MMHWTLKSEVVVTLNKIGVLPRDVYDMELRFWMSVDAQY